MIGNYLQVLEESLHKKMGVLEKIEEANQRQEEILKQEPVPEEAFDKTIEEKGAFIDELNKLDEGFENLYENIREQLTSGREKYKVQIASIQKLITRVTEKKCFHTDAGSTE